MDYRERPAPKNGAKTSCEYGMETSEPIHSSGELYTGLPCILPTEMPNAHECEILVLYLKATHITMFLNPFHIIIDGLMVGFSL